MMPGPVARISELRAGKGALFQAAFQAGPHSGQALKSGFAGACRSTISREARRRHGGRKEAANLLL